MLFDFDKLVARYGKPTGILHVGANRGQEADIYHKYVDRVVWIEAIPHIYEDLIRHVSRYNDKCILACVGDEDGKEVTFHESNNEGQSSSYLNLGTHKEAHPEVHYVKSYKMNMMRLDTLIPIHDIISCDFLAMDIQGAELMALKGLGNYLNDFKYIYLEVNTKEVYEGCALMPDIVEYLGKFGFKKVEEKIYRQWGWGDALFIKR